MIKAMVADRNNMMPPNNMALVINNPDYSLNITINIPAQPVG